MTQELDRNQVNNDLRLVVERAPQSNDPTTQEALFALLAAMQSRTEFRHERDHERAELLASIRR
jgi:hypothetical protein